MTRCCSPQVSSANCLQTALLAGVQGIAHGFFGRKGGMSTGVYAGLNCGQGSNDDPEIIKKNRALVSQSLGVSSNQLLSLYQIHSDKCLGVTEPWSDRPEGDAMVTDVPGIALSVLTADCAPVLFYGQAKGRSVVGAAHAGWKGALSGVLENTVQKMVKDFGVDVGSICAAVGPCIQKKSYEVSAGFYETFLKNDEAYEKFFQESRKTGHHMFDLPGFCAFRLGVAGVRNVQIVEKDTYSEEADYYSFRRTTHRGESDYGRQISVVMIV